MRNLSKLAWGKENSKVIDGAPFLCGKSERIFSLKKRLLWNYLIAAFQYLRAYKKSGEGLFTRACHDRTKGNGFTLQESRFRVDSRKKVFTGRVVRHWDRLPRKVVSDLYWRCLGQTGWSSEQPDHGREIGTAWSLRSLQTQIILWLWEWNGKSFVVVLGFFTGCC